MAGDDIASDAPAWTNRATFCLLRCGYAAAGRILKQAFKTREQIAPYPFIAGLPTKLLGHPKGGALAVVGHIERAWGYSLPGQVRALKGKHRL